MASAAQVKALLQSHGHGDEARFYAVALQVAAAEARAGHAKLAREIRDLVEQAKARKGERRAQANILPLSQPQGEAAELLEPVHSDLRVKHLVLTPTLRERVERIVAEQQNLNRLKEHNLRPRQRLLFTGPPGCGKTMTASALSSELKLPLFVIRLDTLISRYLGDSLSKLRVIFDTANETRAIYFFDEFDAIGYTRDAPGEVGEMRRLLNSFLLFIERLSSYSLIIAATNHGHQSRPPITATNHGHQSRPPITASGSTRRSTGDLTTWSNSSCPARTRSGR
ncbi:ATP-dependent zinc metalloprotease FtsH [Haloferula sargassicola]|uniref:ATP-dependent zinc metalloprotease FtsH n=1 Tax=Haloferula sargassicola TaxID=490096 RepID=A0ABP9UIW5_9BACT